MLEITNNTVFFSFHISGENKPIWMRAEEREENKVQIVVFLL